MDTLAHLLFGGFLKNFLDYETENLDYYLSGTVRPDRGCNDWTNHGSYGGCIDRARGKKFSTIPHWLAAGNQTYANHEQGVLCHYVQDAMDRSKNACRKPGGSNEVIRDVQTIMAHLLLHWSLTGTLVQDGDAAKTAKTILWSISQFFAGVHSVSPMPDGFDAKTVASKTFYYYKSKDLSTKHPEESRYYHIVYKDRFDWLVKRFEQVQAVINMLHASPWVNAAHWKTAVNEVKRRFQLKETATAKKRYLNALKRVVPPIYTAYLKCSQGYPNRHKCWRCSQSAENTPAGQPWCFGSFFYVDKGTPHKTVVRTERLVPWLLDDVATIAAFSFC